MEWESQSRSGGREGGAESPGCCRLPPPGDSAAEDHSQSHDSPEDAATAPLLQPPRPVTQVQGTTPPSAKRGVCPPHARLVPDALSHPCHAAPRVLSPAPWPVPGVTTPLLTQSCLLPGYPTFSLEGTGDQKVSI